MKCLNPSYVRVTNLLANLVALKEPLDILNHKMVKRGRTHATKVLVRWHSEPPEDATWEFYYELLQKSPNFHP